MRMSKLFGRTLREPPADVEGAGHQHMVRARRSCAALAPDELRIFRWDSARLRISRCSCATA